MDAEMREVKCPECGEPLGWQSNAEPRDLLKHNRCPELVARALGMSREDYNAALDLTTIGIVGAFPDFPNNVIGDPKEDDIRYLRARIAAEVVMQCLATIVTMERR